MGSEIVVRRAEVADRDALIAAFARAAVDEPAIAWVMAGSPVDGFVDGYVPEVIDRALATDEIWVAGVEAEIWTVSIWQHVTSTERFFAEAAEAQGFAEAMPDMQVLRRAAIATRLQADQHPTSFPHRYLQIIVTVPEHRGKGSGAALVADRTAAAAAARSSAFLEASSAQSARLYARYGFVAEPRTHTLPEGGPTLRPMWYRPVIDAATR
ncbi:N-acetyltransferase [Nocardia panacis]|uniref:N-acetyltransferase n=1 Tax=Nocardia panacis TaxID=2340916 RepID=A0A3A4K7C8_9NOCA|nr:GNAT family N-acetyltransferase [Nocardia panacis]RJO69068.1 N-acetyltransferase [Nocardia panacis]